MEPTLVAISHTQIQEGRVVEFADDEHRVLVDLPNDTRVACVRLYSGTSPVTLGIGDRVLVCGTDGEDRPRILLGRIGPSGQDARARNGDEPQDELVIEARKQLTLKVGDGSITIREDGRILIKGRDLVSHAKRNNRIRGGSVTIN